MAGELRVDPRVQRTRAAVHTAAIELLETEGPDAVTHRRVAERAGVSRSAVYRHWNQPEDLLIEAMASLALGFDVRSGGNLRSALVRELTLRARDLNNPAIVALFSTMMLRALHDETVAGLRGQLVDNIVGGLAASVKDAVRHNELRRGLSPETLARQIVGPLLYRRFLEGREVDAKLIVTTVDAALKPWLTIKP